MIFQPINLEQARAFQKAALEVSKNEPPFEREFAKRLFQIELYAFWGAEFFAGVIDGKIVSLNATRISKGKSRDAWGKYSSFYLAYTLPAHRHMHYATNLQKWVADYAKAEGMDRVRSLIGSFGGFRLHRRLGHDFWGMTDEGEIVVDSPLTDEQFPEGVPKRARKYCKTGQRMTHKELFYVLMDPKGRFRLDDDMDAYEALEGYAY